MRIGSASGAERRGHSEAGGRSQRRDRAPAFAGEQAAAQAHLQGPARLELLPRRIEELEAAIARDEAALSDHDLYLRDPRLFEALTDAVAAAKAERDAAEHRWLELAEQAEALQPLDAGRAPGAAQARAREALKQ